MKYKCTKNILNLMIDDFCVFFYFQFSNFFIKRAVMNTLADRF